jgi:hypothetical protein
LALGAWLILSAFLWQHTIEQFNNAWMVGLATAIVAAIAMRVDSARYVNMALAVWLFLSVFILTEPSIGTTWNHLVVAVAIFLTATTPNLPVRRTPSGQPPIAGASP